MTSPDHELFVVTAPGLEGVVVRELAALGLPAMAVPGGATLRGTRADLLRLHLWLRTASRVLLRVAAFPARGFLDLERELRRLDWRRFLSRGDLVRVRATSHRSRLYHTGAIAERLRDALREQVGELREAPRTEDEREDEAGAGQLILVRLVEDRAEVSVDASGDLMHRRGYRLQAAKAPLRETLAAAMLLTCGWDGALPLVDPMCGSGTIPIEAAMIARRIAPGLRRRYRFMDWPGHDPAAWDALVAEARAGQRPLATTIGASDRDAGAVEAATANADRAGVLGDIDLRCTTLSRVRLAGDAGWVITNPPYGVRLGDARLRDLYAAIGHLRRDHPRWHLGVLTGSTLLGRHLGVPVEERLDTRNGGLRVRLLATG